MLSLDWSVLFYDVLKLVLLVWIVFSLVPLRHQAGNVWLIAGFGLIFLFQMALLIFSDEFEGSAWLLALELIQVVGFGLIGYASWIKIKGKVTHHFLKIVSLVYAVLFVFTAGLASVIVTDEISLQLLLLLMTGVLIIILPIIHALTYSHPHQPPQS